jgi:hypothetical protein
MLLQPYPGQWTYVVSYQIMSALFDFGILAIFLAAISVLRLLAGRRAAGH